MSGAESTLALIREWEEIFISIYKRKPKMIEREQFFWGVLLERIARATARCA